MPLIDANHHYISNDVYAYMLLNLKKKINMIKFLSISFPGIMSAV